MISTSSIRQRTGRFVVRRVSGRRLEHVLAWKTSYGPWGRSAWTLLLLYVSAASSVGFNMLLFDDKWLNVGPTKLDPEPVYRTYEDIFDLFHLEGAGFVVNVFSAVVSRLSIPNPFSHRSPRLRRKRKATLVRADNDHSPPIESLHLGPLSIESSS